MSSIPARIRRRRDQRRRSHDLRILHRTIDDLAVIDPRAAADLRAVERISQT